MSNNSEKLVKDIRRRTRKKYSSEEKIRIVLEGMRGEESIAELCRREGRTGGRKRKMDDSKIAVAKRLLQDGIAPREVARSLEISIPTLYRWLPASQRL